MTVTVATAKLVYTADNTDLINKTTQSSNAVGAATASMGGKITALGGKIKDLGQSWTIATAPITAALGVSIKKFGSFEEAMANANSITGTTGTAAKELAAEILALGTGAREGPQAVAEAWFDVVSGVAAADTRMAVLSTAIALSEANAAGLQGTLGALIGTSNAYGLSADEMAHVSDVFTATVQNGVLTMDELAASLGNVVPTAVMAGVSVEDVASSMASITQQGLSASKASTGLNQAIIGLQKPNAELAAVMDNMGLSMDELIAQEGLAGTFAIIGEAAESAGMNMGDMFGSADAGAAAFILAGDNASALADKFNSTLTPAAQATQDRLAAMGAFDGADMSGVDDMTVGIEGATAAANAIQSDTMTAEIDLMVASLDALAVTVGETLAPAMKDIAKFVVEFTSGLTDWIGENEKLAAGIIKVLAVMVVLGPALFVLGVFIVTMGAAVTTLTALWAWYSASAGIASLATGLVTGAMGLATTAMGLLTGALGLLFSPFVLAVAGGIALGAAIWFAMQKAGGLKNMITGGLTAGFQLLMIIAMGAILIIKGVFAAIGDFITEFMIIPIQSIIAFILPTLTTKWNEFKETMSSVFTSIGGFITDFFIEPIQSLIDITMPALSALISPIGDLFETVFGTTITGAIQKVSDFLTKLIEGLGWLFDAIEAIGSLDITGGGGGGGRDTNLGPGGQKPKTNATGGTLNKGQLSLVGEQGPELITAGKSMRVHSNDMSKSIMSGGGGRTIIVNNPVFHGIDDIASFYDAMEREGKRR